MAEGFFQGLGWPMWNVRNRWETRRLFVEFCIVEIPMLLRWLIEADTVWFWLSFTEKWELMFVSHLKCKRAPVWFIADGPTPGPHTIPHYDAVCDACCTGLVLGWIIIFSEHNFQCLLMLVTWLTIQSNQPLIFRKNGWHQYWISPVYLKPETTAISLPLSRVWSRSFQSIVQYSRNSWYNFSYWQDVSRFHGETKLHVQKHVSLDVWLHAGT